MAPGTRDLSSTELWYESLERSQRRRELSELARKVESRKKSASLAVTAAMATTPVAPTFTTFGGDGPSRASASHTRILEQRDDAARVLLERGMTSAAVIEVQDELKIAEDGVFGPVTERAVKRFQAKHGLPVTGKIDVRTWLTLFPDGMVVYDAKSQSAQLASEAPPSAVQGLSGANLTASEGAGETAQDRAVAASQARAGGAPHGVDAHEGILPDRDAERGKKTRKSTKRERRGSSHDARDTVAGVVEERSSRGGSGGGSSRGSGGGGGGPVGGPINVAPGLGSAQEMIAAMIAAANKIDKAGYRYQWGGGHNPRFSGPYDCSGAVSAVLHAAGLINRPMVSGEFMRWGRPGPGAVTIYANAGHVYMSINGRFFGTTRANPGGGAGWFNGSKRPGFVVVHVPFESMKFKKSTRKAKAKPQTTRTRTRAATQANEPAPSGSSGSTASRDAQSGGTTYQSSSGEAASGTAGQPQPQQAPAEQPAQQAPAQEAAPAQAAPAPAPAAAPAPDPAQAAPAPAPEAAPATEAPAPAAAPAPAPETAPAPAPEPAAPVAEAPAPAAEAPAAEPSTPAPEAPAAEAPAAEAPAPEAPAAEAPAADAAATATEAATESKDDDSADEQQTGTAGQ